jgi:3-phenylpropionate/trans-cinnamate dioxygenase ferredoxin reductase component
VSGQPDRAGPGVVVVGGSLAGVHVAEVLRAEGYAGHITVVDADPEPHYDRPPISKEYRAPGGAQVLT